MTDKEYEVMKEGTPAVRGVSDDKRSHSWLGKLGVVVIIVIAFVMGIYAGRVWLPDDVMPASPIVNSTYKIVGDIKGEGQDVEELDFDLFWQVWNAMQQQYVDEEQVDQKEMLNGAIKGLVSSYGDPATLFLDAEETTEFNKSSAGNYFSGIGAELGYKNGQIVIISPIKGSPAIKAGLRPGDIILDVDGEGISPDENIYDIVFRIRGEEGTDVVLTVMSKGDTETKDVTIKRGQITVPSMEFEVSNLDSDVAVFDVARFTDSSVSEWKDNWDKMVSDFKSSGAKSIILDLRGNPGGYVNSAVHAANDLLDEGEMIALLESRDGTVDEYIVTRKGELTDVPIVILVNEGSASASEILAGALQKNGRAVVVGETTYGKGTAQDIVDYEDGSSLHITVMKWLMPDGTWLNPDNPITPDHEVELTNDDFTQGVDPQMDKAIELLQQEI